MRLELSAFPTLGNYRFGSLPLDDLTSFVPQKECAACGAEDRWMPLVRLGGKAAAEALVLQTCQECLHVSYDRMPSEAWLSDFYGGTWDQSRRRRPPKISRSRLFSTAGTSPWSYIPYFKSLGLPHEARILDFGCGFGDGLVALEQLGYQNVFGVEVGSHRVAVAKRHFSERVVTGSLSAAAGLREREGRFDLIILNHVAEHLGEPLAALRQLATLLSDQGLLAVSVPNRWSESPVHLPLYFPHLHHFSPSSLMSLFMRAGLIPHRWTGSEVQLAVIGSGHGYKRAGFVTERPAVASSACEEVARYVQAPWAEDGQRSGQRVCLNYFHPWLRPSSPAGFQPMSPRVGRWLSRSGRGLVPLVVAAERHGMDNHQLARRMVNAATRALGQAAPVGGEFVQYRRDNSAARADGDVPWLVGVDNNVPILSK